MSPVAFRNEATAAIFVTIFRNFSQMTSIQIRRTTAIVCALNICRQQRLLTATNDSTRPVRVDH